MLLDASMMCRVGDFGLSVDLSGGDDGDDSGFYAGSEGAKIPVRWTAIEVCAVVLSPCSPRL